MNIESARQNLSASIDEANWQNQVQRLSQREKVKEVAREFEAIFTEILVKSMRNTVEKSKLFDGGNAEEIYQSMLDREYATQMASGSLSGLATQIEKQMLESLGEKTDVLSDQKKIKGGLEYKKMHQP